MCQSSVHEYFFEHRTVNQHPGDHAFGMAFGDVVEQTPVYRQRRNKRYNRCRRIGQKPLYRGIRYGNLWHYDLVQQVTIPPSSTTLLAQHDLVLETAN